MQEARHGVDHPRGSEPPSPGAEVGLEEQGSGDTEGWMWNQEEVLPRMGAGHNPLPGMEVGALGVSSSTGDAGEGRRAPGASQRQVQQRSVRGPSRAWPEGIG